MPVRDGELESRNQPLIFRKIVGLMSQVFAQPGQLSSCFIFNYDSISRRSRVAAGAPVSVSNEVMLRKLRPMREKRVNAAGRRHGLSLQRLWLKGRQVPIKTPANLMILNEAADFKQCLLGGRGP